MAKKETKKIRKLAEGKKKIMSKQLEEYDIETAEDIQSALADLLGGTIKGVMKAVNTGWVYLMSSRIEVLRTLWLYVPIVLSE